MLQTAQTYFRPPFLINKVDFDNKDLSKMKIACPIYVGFVCLCLREPCHIKKLDLLLKALSLMIFSYQLYSLYKLSGILHLLWFWIFEKKKLVIKPIWSLSSTFFPSSRFCWHCLNFDMKMSVFEFSTKLKTFYWTQFWSNRFHSFISFHFTWCDCKARIKD